MDTVPNGAEPKHVPPYLTRYGTPFLLRIREARPRTHLSLKSSLRLNLPHTDRPGLDFLATSLVPFFLTPMSSHLLESIKKSYAYFTLSKKALYGRTLTQSQNLGLERVG